MRFTGLSGRADLRSATKRRIAEKAYRRLLQHKPLMPLEVLCLRYLLQHFVK